MSLEEQRHLSVRMDRYIQYPSRIENDEAVERLGKGNYLPQRKMVRYINTSLLLGKRGLFFHLTLTWLHLECIDYNVNDVASFANEILCLRGLETLDVTRLT